MAPDAQQASPRRAPDSAGRRTQSGGYGMFATNFSTRGTRWTRRSLLLAATVLTALSSPVAPARAADNWQAYTYWGTPTVVASRNFRKLTEDIEQLSGGELKIKFNLGGTLSINAININSAVSDDIIQIADDAFFHGSLPIAGLSALPFLIHGVDEMSKAMTVVR